MEEEDQRRRVLWSDDPVENAGIVWRGVNELISYEFNYLMGSTIPPAANMFNFKKRESFKRVAAARRKSQMLTIPVEIPVTPSKCSLNEIMPELKSSSPISPRVRNKCDYYGKVRSPDVSDIDVLSNYQNAQTVDSAASSSVSSLTMDDDRRYFALESEIAELKKQIATLTSVVVKSTAASSLNSSSSQKCTPTKKPPLPPKPTSPRPPIFVPPAPPLPPPPSTPTVVTNTAKICINTSISIRRRIGGGDEVEVSQVRNRMGNVLQNLNEAKAKLKPIHRKSSSPRQLFKSSRRNSDMGSMHDSIAEALRRKFANVKVDSPLSDAENSFSESFDSDTDDFVKSPTTSLMNRRPLRKQIFTIS